MLTGKSCKKKN